MKILVDADACPVKQIIVECAKKYDLPVMMFCDTSHILYDGYSEIIVVDKGADRVDIALANRITKEDKAVTNDYGLASLILARGAKALGASGLIYTTENIDKLLFVRHVSREVRKAKKGRTKGVPPRSAEDDENFRKSLIKLIENGLA